jgi:hypothetical protein
MASCLGQSDGPEVGLRHDQDMHDQDMAAASSRRHRYLLQLAVSTYAAYRGCRHLAAGGLTFEAEVLTATVTTTRP